MHPQWLAIPVGTLESRPPFRVVQPVVALAFGVFPLGMARPSDLNVREVSMMPSISALFT
jgi:hypothetical protein